MSMTTAQAAENAGNRVDEVFIAAAKRLGPNPRPTLQDAKVQDQARWREGAVVAFEQAVQVLREEAGADPMLAAVLSSLEESWEDYGDRSDVAVLVMQRAGS